jgi:regulator of protease activity HflC (stomatin/prohibitin superfamily)
MWEMVVQLIASLRVIRTVLPHEQGVVCRLGKVKRTVGPSVVWLWPIVDKILVMCVAEQVEDLRCQSITTTDGKSILVSGKLRYRVSDPELALFEVYDWDEALADEALGILATECMKRTFEECLNHTELAHEVEKAVRRQAKKWGIEVTGFTLTDMVIHRAIRLEWNKSLVTSDE